MSNIAEKNNVTTGPTPKSAIKKENVMGQEHTKRVFFKPGIEDVRLIDYQLDRRPFLWKQPSFYGLYGNATARQTAHQILRNKQVAHSKYS